MNKKVVISIDDVHPERGWGLENDKQIQYLNLLNKEFGCKFTLFIPSNYHKQFPLSQYKDWVSFWREKDWIELAAHGHFHLGKNDECEFNYFDKEEQVKKRIDLCLEEWNKINYIPMGWKYPGWIATKTSHKVINKVFEYISIHQSLIKEFDWDIKVIAGCDGINADDYINEYNNTYLFQSHINGHSNKNNWNALNYVNFRRILTLLKSKHSLKFLTMSELI